MDQRQPSLGRYCRVVILALSASLSACNLQVSKSAPTTSRNILFANPIPASPLPSGSQAVVVPTIDPVGIEDGTLNGDSAGRALALSVPKTPAYVDMSTLWPVPATGKSLLRIYNFKASAAAKVSSVEHCRRGDIPNALVQRTRAQTYQGFSYFTNEDFGGPNQWFSTWYMSKDAKGTVREFADAVVQFNKNYTQALSHTYLKFKPGNEIVWGGRYYPGTTVNGQVIGDRHYSTTYNYASQKSEQLVSDIYGWNSITLISIIPAYVVNGKTYKNVALFKLYQVFCDKSDDGCAAKKEWYINYYVVPNLGKIQQDIWEKYPEDAGFCDLGSYHLRTNCERSDEGLNCP